MELSEDGNSYHIKSTTSAKCAVDVTFTRLAPGFKAGKDGTSTFGTDPHAPWGHMVHKFWPSCAVSGTFKTADGEVDMRGKGLYIYAMQGMKPHHAAARWNFVNFKSPSYTAVMMEFTTPASYGSTVVNVGGIATEGELLFAGAGGKAEHTASSKDAQNDWPAPTAARYTWRGKTRDGKDVSAELAGPLGERLDRIDVMDEVPGFVKQIVAGVAGTKPYIYQVRNPWPGRCAGNVRANNSQYGPKLKLKIKVGDEEKDEEGTLFTEATFIS